MVEELALQTHFPQAVRAHMVRDIPLGRIGRVSEVAALCVFLLSEQSRFLTGAEFAVDGGMTAR